MPPREFRMDVSDTVLDDLRERLARTRWPRPLPGEPWAHGASVDYARELCSYWQRDYDWRHHQASLNAYPQFVSTIDGVDFHYWHVRGRGTSPLPLLLVHGWPGSICEFHHLIDSITDPEEHGGAACGTFIVDIRVYP